MESPFIISDPNLYAEWSYMEAVENALKVSDAVPVAVGSGVINDLTKLASFRLGRRYVCVGTAASMDGYTAYGASITFKGNKRTFDCPAPLGFVMDSSIAAAAPYKMSASGYADLIAKIPAGADWIIAECAGIEKINSFAFDVVQKGLKNALSDPAAIRAGDEAEVEKLAEGLLLSGFAMQACQNSRPASGIEHQLPIAEIYGYFKGKRLRKMLLVMCLATQNRNSTLGKYVNKSVFTVNSPAPCTRQLMF